MHTKRIHVLMLGVICSIGCVGNQEISIPSDKLTEEQKELIRKEDSRIADEESQGAKRR
jgi:hypothetical protein